jgi:class 3 adenylate cyclase/pimeloyl-ACP methyl ester carboxylesterase
MLCPQCQRENPPQAKFCRGCGYRFAPRCAQCGTELASNDQFCMECGTSVAPPAGAQPLPADRASRFTSPQTYTPQHLAERILTSRAALEGERKHVTVLFADLKGSLQLLADRDPEEARALLDPVLERMMEAVHRYEGTVNQVMGDGIMALFGAPIAHEDHAVRACYAALQMQGLVAAYGAEVRRAKGVPIQIRVGLNSGEVVVRSISSDLRVDYSAVGQTTHLAARMEQLATPGATLLSPATLQLVEGYVRVKPLGPMAIQGLPQPLEVYELAGATPTRSRLHTAVARGLTRFVGRAAEMDTLHRALEQAGAGHGQLVAIVGEPGVGKSRLVYELVHSHRSHGWLVLESSSVSYGKATPYLPVTDLLRGYFLIEDRDSRQAVREKVTGKILTLDEHLKDTIAPLVFLLDALPEDDPFHSLEPPQRRGRTVEALKQVLLRESQRQPVLMIFEDLHWIDAESESVLDAVVESLPASRALCLVNYRPEYQDRWGAKTYYVRLRLDALPPEDADQLLDALVGVEPALGALRAVLKERTEGNPFFLEECVRALAETGVLSGPPGAYRLDGPLSAFQIPATVQPLLAARIDRLPVEGKRLLQSAAVVGMEIPFALLRGAVDLPEDELYRALGHLVRTEFLYESRLFPEPAFTFKHALTRQVAYGTLLQERRRLLHRRVGELIEHGHADRLAPVAETLAGHFEHAEVWPKATTYYLMAAENARQHYNYAAAMDLCTTSVDLAAKGDDLESPRIAALVLLGDLASLMGELEPANASYDRALAACTDPAERRRIANKRHELRSVSRGGASLAFYEHGSGDETLVLVHTLVYGLASFQPIVEQLCQEFRIITLDFRGTGRSDPLPATYSRKDHAEDVRAVIESATDRPVVGIGTSSGATLLVRVAATYPALFKGLVLVTTAPARVDPSQRPQRWADRLGNVPFTVENIGVILSKLATWVYSEPGTQDLVAQFVSNGLRLPPETVLNFLAPDPATDVSALLPRLRVPTLVMHGTADQMTPLERSQYLVEQIAGAQLYTFEGRGHGLLHTATIEFCEVLRRFLRTGAV